MNVNSAANQQLFYHDYIPPTGSHRELHINGAGVNANWQVVTVQATTATAAQQVATAVLQQPPQITDFSLLELPPLPNPETSTQIPPPPLASLPYAAANNPYHVLPLHFQQVPLPPIPIPSQLPLPPIPVAAGLQLPLPTAVPPINANGSIYHQTGDATNLPPIPAASTTRRVAAAAANDAIAASSSSRAKRKNVTSVKTKEKRTELTSVERTELAERVAEIGMHWMKIQKAHFPNHSWVILKETYHQDHIYNKSTDTAAAAAAGGGGADVETEPRKKSRKTPSPHNVSENKPAAAAAAAAPEATTVASRENSDYDSLASNVSDSDSTDGPSSLRITPGLYEQQAPLAFIPNLPPVHLPRIKPPALVEPSDTVDGRFRIKDGFNPMLKVSSLGDIGSPIPIPAASTVSHPPAAAAAAASASATSFNTDLDLPGQNPADDVFALTASDHAKTDEIAGFTLPDSSKSKPENETMGITEAEFKALQNEDDISKYFKTDS